MRVVARNASDPDAVTLGLATALLDRNCDMLLSARISGARMDGNMRIGTCDAQGARVVAVALIRR